MDVSSELANEKMAGCNAPRQPSGPHLVARVYQGSRYEKNIPETPANKVYFPQKKCHKVTSNRHSQMAQVSLFHWCVICLVGAGRMPHMSNNNSRTRLILQLAKQASARYDDEWEVRLDRANMDSTSSDILISEEIQDNRKGCHNGQQTPLSVIEAEPQPALCSYDTIVESSEAVQFLVDTHSENNQSSSRVTEDSVAESGSQLELHYFNSENDTNLDGDSTEDDVSKQKRKRSRIPKKEEWSREKAKIRRMNGMSYIGYTRDRKGKVFHNKERENRVMGPRCQSNKCMKYKNRFCINMSEDERNSIFKKFWEDMSWDQKKIYVSNLVQKKDIERKFVENSRRSSTYNYFLKIGHENKQVCNRCFYLHWV
nr:unnamed protein product [Callosobruchus chinensis]